MNWNRAVYERLTNSPEFSALIPPDRVLAGGGINVIPPPEHRPFIVLRFGAESPTEVKPATDQSLEGWVHDDPGDFQRINEVLGVLKVVLQSMSGGDIISVVWTGNSEGFPDDSLRTITRYGTYRLLGKAA